MTFTWALGAPAGDILSSGQTLYVQSALMEAVLDRDAQGQLIRKAGVMGIVLAGGEVRPADPIRVELPPEPHRPLEPV